MRQNGFEYAGRPGGIYDFGGGEAGRRVDVLCQDLDLFCEQYARLGSDAALQRKRQTQGRLAWIKALWDDPVRFEAVVASGRYRRLCALTRAISQADARAWQRLKEEILDVRAREFLCGAEAA
jgi:hypothetical protein